MAWLLFGSIFLSAFFLYLYFIYDEKHVWMLGESALWIVVSLIFYVGL